MDARDLETVVAGYWDGTLNLGMAEVRSNGASDAFVLRLTDDSVGWNALVTGPGRAAIQDVTPNSVDEVFIVGEFDGDVILDAEVLSSVGADADAMGISPTGIVTWAQRWGDATDQSVSDIAVDLEMTLASASLCKVTPF